MNPFEKQTIVIGEYSIKDIVKTNKTEKTNENALLNLLFN